MGASLGSPGGGGNRRRFRKGRFTEINVTPMVDVMLVLLIIFMVTAPMLTAGVQVDLPKGGQPLQGQDEPLTVSVQADGKVFLNKNPVTLDELSAKMKAIAAEKPDTRVFVRGDKAVDYGRIMHVVGAVNAAGITKVALITEQTGTQSTSDNPSSRRR